MLTPIAEIFAQPDDIRLRAYLESLRTWLANERQRFDVQWRDLAQFMLPRVTRFNYTEVDSGERKDYALIDNCATIGVRTLGSSMLSNMSSPTRKWFRLRMENDELNDQQEVAEWLEQWDDIIRRTFIKSNFYQTIHGAYREEACFGTTAFEMQEDKDADIRCYPWPIGSYYLTTGHDLRIDGAMRIVNKTAKQLVNEYGLDNLSTAVRSFYESNAGGLKEQWWPIVQFICRNTYWGVKTLEARTLPWLSMHYEMQTFKPDQGILRKSGFHEFPVIAGRWDVTGEDVYGNSPGMDCLGDVMALQLQQKRKQQAIDKQVNPPMLANPALMGLKLSTLAGDVTFAETRENSPGFKPAFQIQYQLEHAVQDIKETQARIRSALYTDVFLAMLTSDRREMTAEEVRAKSQEKLSLIGPVLNRNDDEILKPSVLRTFSILYRNGKGPKVPEILAGQPFKVEFGSILEQVQKMLQITNAQQLLQMVGSEIAINQGIADVIDLDEVGRNIAKALDRPAAEVRPPEVVKQIRADRQRQQQQAQQAENAQKLAQAAQSLGNTPMGSGSALDSMIQRTQGGA